MQMISFSLKYTFTVLEIKKKNGESEGEEEKEVDCFFYSHKEQTGCMLLLNFPFFSFYSL